MAQIELKSKRNTAVFDVDDTTLLDYLRLDPRKHRCVEYRLPRDKYEVKQLTQRLFFDGALTYQDLEDIDRAQRRAFTLIIHL